MTRPANVAILGATGSIGRQALDVIDRNPARLKLFGLTEGTRTSTHTSTSTRTSTHTRMALATAACARSST